MKSFVSAVCQLFLQKETLVIATVMESSGSTPRSSGSKMAIRHNGKILGTVGGGSVEALACQRGLDMIHLPDGSMEVAQLDLTQELAANTDMICGGSLTILLETLSPAGEGAAAYTKLNELLRKGNKALLSTTYSTETMRTTSHTITQQQTESPNAAMQTLQWQVAGTEGKLSEPFTPPIPLFIFGAGHVSQPTAKIGALLGFRTVILDDRVDFANTERFPEADEIQVLPSFENCCTQTTIPEEAYIIIVTRGHLHDKTVLAQALRTKAKYIGMIGSKKKRDAIYTALYTEGFSQAEIQRCHCPIGLSIGAQTPEEIAVSIAAELVAVKAER